MIITCVKDNHLYLSFQDFEDNINDIYNELLSFPLTSRKIIKKILDKNFFSNTLERQTSYINTISTYIDAVGEGNQQYFLHLYIIPKDINMNFESELSNYEKIQLIEKLSIKLFKLYSNFISDKKLINLFKHSEGKSFLQLESQFYIEKLENIYNILLNYKIHYKKKIICSDKQIGIPVEELNILEKNPLKNYQFIKSPYQKDLIRFVYSVLTFLKKYRLEIFKTNNISEYDILLKLINKINNLLLKISTHKSIALDTLDKKNLKKYFKKYENNKELKNNPKLFKLIKSIFYTQLKTNASFFISIDLTKVFEQVVEKKLYMYKENLYIGKEFEKCIEKFSDKTNSDFLNNENYLLEKSDNIIKQYPDFLIEDHIKEKTIYHTIDAKYKLRKNIFNSSDIRQVLVYSLLFNKEFSSILSNQKYIKKAIIYAEKSIIEMNDISNLELDFNHIDLETEGYEFYRENLFNSDMLFIPIKVLKSL